MSKTVLQHYSNIILLLEQLLHFLKVVIGQPVEPAATTFYTWNTNSTFKKNCF